MARSAFQAKAHSDILRKVFDLPARGITRPLAQSILALDFPDDAAVRIELLNDKANQGALTEAEEADLEAYVNVGDLLAYWQSKARQALQQPA